MFIVEWFITLAPPGGENKLCYRFLMRKMTARVGVGIFFNFFKFKLISKIRTFWSSRRWKSWSPKNPLKNHRATTSGYPLIVVVLFIHIKLSSKFKSRHQAVRHRHPKTNKNSIGWKKCSWKTSRENDRQSSGRPKRVNFSKTRLRHRNRYSNAGAWSLWRQLTVKSILWEAKWRNRLQIFSLSSSIGF